MKRAIYVSFNLVMMAVLLLPAHLAATQHAPAAGPATARLDQTAWNVERVSEYDTPGLAQDVVVSGHYAYVADWSAGLRILDVTDPAASLEVGFHDTPDWARNVAVAGNHAYVADAHAGLRIIHVADPAAPVEVGFFDTSDHAYAVAVAGDFAYVADGWDGLRIINVANPSAPVATGFYDTVWYARGVAVAGNYAYVADTDAGLRVIHVANPSAPVEIGSVYAGEAAKVAVVGDYAYVAGGFAGLRIINIANPAVPVTAGYYDPFFYDPEGDAADVAVDGNYAYIAYGQRGLRVVDVTNPTAPVEVGYYDTPGYAGGVAVAGNLVYVVDRAGGLFILRFMLGACEVNPGVFSGPEGTLASTAISWSTQNATDPNLTYHDNQGISETNWVNPASPTGSQPFQWSIWSSPSHHQVFTFHVKSDITLLGACSFTLINTCRLQLDAEKPVIDQVRYEGNAVRITFTDHAPDEGRYHWQKQFSDDGTNWGGFGFDWFSEASSGTQVITDASGHVDRNVHWQYRVRAEQPLDTNCSTDWTESRILSPIPANALPQQYLPLTLR